VKFCSISCVIAWFAFWIFGYLALTEPFDATAYTVPYVLVAGLSMLTGTFTYLKLARGNI